MAYAGKKKPKKATEKEPAKVALPDLETLVGWVDEWDEKTADNRALMLRDCEYYDGKQWTQEEIDELEGRGQPVTVNNRIARKTNFIVGDEVEKGIDPVVRPRTEQHEDDAKAATSGLRNVEENQKYDDFRSLCFTDYIKAGLMGLVVEGPEDPDDIDELCAPLTHVPWDRLIWDPRSKRPGDKDSKYKGAHLWLDYDDALEMYPDHEDELAAAFDEHSNSNVSDDRPRMWAHDGKRKRVRIAELYFRAGKGKAREWYKACFTKGALFEIGPTGYLDKPASEGGKSVCPLIIEPCYVDTENNPYGVIRALISAQDEINKRKSKQLYLLSVNGAMVERDTITDPQAFLRELAKPDGLPEVEPDALKDGRVVPRNNLELSQGQAQMLAKAEQDIDSLGPSSASIPELPNSASGVAFSHRTKAASKELAPVFAGLRRFDLAVMEQNWMRIVQYKTEEWWFRVSDDKELTGYRFVALNRKVTRLQRLQELMQRGVPFDSALVTAAGDDAPRVMQEMASIHATMPQAPQGQEQAHMMAMLTQSPLMAQPVTINQAASMKVDIMVETGSESSIIADEQFRQLTDLAPAMAAAGKPLPPEFLVRASALPNKRELLEVLKKGDEPNPQMAQLQQTMQQLAMQLQQATVAKTQAEAAAKGADAEKTKAETQLLAPKTNAEIEVKKAQAMNTAADAGGKLANPQPEGAPDGFRPQPPPR